MILAAEYGDAGEFVTTRRCAPRPPARSVGPKRRSSMDIFMIAIIILI